LSLIQNQNLVTYKPYHCLQWRGHCRERKQSKG